MEKNVDIQLFRGVAIVAVVMNHSFTGHMWFDLYGQAFVNFAVPLFLFLSGYLTKIQYEDYSVVIKRRFIKVAIPYIFWSCVCCFFLVDNINVKKVLFCLFTGKACFPYYYIIVYLQFAILLKYINRLASSKLSWIGFIFSPLCLLLLFYIPLFTSVSFNTNISEIIGISILPWFIFFYTGLLIGNGKLKYSLKPGMCFIVLFLSIIFQIVESNWLFNISNGVISGTGGKLTAYITSLITCLFCVSCVNAKVNNYIPRILYKILYILGNCSFGIYLIHILIRDGIRYFGGDLICSEFIEMPIVLTLSTIIVFYSKKYLPSQLNRVLGF